MTQNIHHSLTNLKTRIALSRQKLESLWAAKGCTDEEILAAGDELDLLFNEYHKMKNHIEG